MTQAPPERLEAVIRGVVQGVGYRWFVRDTAARLGLRGWVANRSDGSVAVIAEGAAEVLTELEACLRQGPPGASVDEVAARREAARGAPARFEIRSGSHPGD